MGLRAFLLVLPLLVTMKAYCVKPEVIIDTDKLRVYTCDTLVYFGLDFSQFYLLNELKLDQGHKMKDVYAPVWIQKFNEDYDAKRLKKLFDVEMFIYHTNSFQSKQLEKVNPELMVREKSSLMDSVGIRKIVRAYEPSTYSGVGVSLIVEEFNKSTEFASIIFTFFDIETKEVLFASRAFGFASGTGMEWHWRNGLTKTMYDFMITEYYFDRKKIIKQYKKNSR